MMTKEQKIIKAKVGVLELAKQLETSARPVRCWLRAIAFIGSTSSYEGVRCQARFDQRIVFFPWSDQLSSIDLRRSR